MRMVETWFQPSRAWLGTCLGTSSGIPLGTSLGTWLGVLVISFGALSCKIAENGQTRKQNSAEKFTQGNNVAGKTEAVADKQQAQFSLMLPEASGSGTGQQQARRARVRVYYDGLDEPVEREFSMTDRRASVQGLPLGPAKILVELLDAQGEVVRSGVSEPIELAPGANRVAIALNRIDLKPPGDEPSDADLMVILREPSDEERRDPRRFRPSFRPGSAGGGGPGMGSPGVGGTGPGSASGTASGPGIDPGGPGIRPGRSPIDQMTPVQRRQRLRRLFSSLGPVPICQEADPDCAYKDWPLDRPRRLEVRAQLIRFLWANSIRKPFRFVVKHNSEANPTCPPGASDCPTPLLVAVGFLDGNWKFVETDSLFKDFSWAKKNDPVYKAMGENPGVNEPAEPISSDMDAETVVEVDEMDIEEVMGEDVPQVDAPDTDQPNAPVTGEQEEQEGQPGQSADSSVGMPSLLSLDAVRDRLRAVIADLLEGAKSIDYTLEATTFGDGCLGLAKAGEFCTQAMVPGYIVTININAGGASRTVVAHASQDLQNIRLKP